MLIKKVLITSCEDCPYVWWYLGRSPKCNLKNKKSCWNDIPEEEEIPKWCPLKDATNEEIKFIENLKDKAGYVEE